MFPYQTPKPKVMETPNLACGLVFTIIFLENQVLVDDDTIVTLRPYLRKMTSFLQ